MKQAPLNIVFEYKDSKLVPANEIELAKYSNYLKALKEGDKVHLLLYEQEDANYAQLKKLYFCISEFSKFTGFTIGETKTIVKQKAGLISPEGDMVSFADCTRDELSIAIAAIIELGQAIDLNLY